MIDKVYVLNLPHRVDRRYYMMGHLHTIGVPPRRLHFVKAKYHADFNSAAEIREAAIADGFSFFKRPRWQAFNYKYPLVFTWGYAGILRQIIEDDANALVLLDDRFLEIELRFLAEIVEYLEDNYPPFYMLQLQWWIPAHGPEWQMSLAIKGERYKDDDLVSDLIAKGVGGCGDFANVYSPAGAQFLLDYLDNLRFNTAGLEWNLVKLLEPGTAKTGMFHFIRQMVHGPPVDWGDDALWEE